MDSTGGAGGSNNGGSGGSGGGGGSGTVAAPPTETVLSQGLKLGLIIVDHLLAKGFTSLGCSKAKLLDLL